MSGNKLTQFLCAVYRQHVLQVSQTHIANEIGCSRQIVSNFENGKKYNEGKMGAVYDWYLDNGFDEFLIAVKKKLGE